jgi:dTDP-4-amino-4,6-dideoxygalactose transaminase
MAKPGTPFHSYCDGRPSWPQELTIGRKNGEAARRPRCDSPVMSILEIQSSSKNALAIHGAGKTVTAQGPANFLHGSQEIGQEEIDAVTRVLKSQSLFRFFKDRSESMVAQFEDLFAEKCGAEYVLAVNSGTSALIAGLIGIGVGQGDEVLVPAYTYIATAAAALAIGAIPVVVEVDGALTLDPQDIVRKITPRTRAILPVHMRGVPCDMEKITAIAREHHLKVLEDCAQANGGFYKGRALGTWGDAGAYSLQHFKIITAGEGGVVVTNDKRVFERAAIYHDSAYTFWIENTIQQQDPAAFEEWRKGCFLGENYRQSELHGAVAFEQLKKRDAILARTRWIKKRLREASGKLPGFLVEESHDPEGDCGISLVIFAENGREAARVAEILQAEGVPCGTRFSRQIPDRHVFYHWDYIMEKRSPHRNGFPWNTALVEYAKEMCPQTLGLLERVIAFPITQRMSNLYVDQICQAIEKVANSL